LLEAVEAVSRAYRTLPPGVSGGAGLADESELTVGV